MSNLVLPEKEMSQNTTHTYHIQGTLALNEPAVAAQRNQAGRFVLATNLLDDELWSNEIILQEYKNQQSCERGFRFLKDPLFFASFLTWCRNQIN